MLVLVARPEGAGACALVARVKRVLASGTVHSGMCPFLLFVPVCAPVHELRHALTPLHPQKILREERVAHAASPFLFLLLHTLRAAVVPSLLTSRMPQRALPTRSPVLVVWSDVSLCSGGVQPCPANAGRRWRSACAAVGVAQPCPCCSCAPVGSQVAKV